MPPVDAFAENPDFKTHFLKSAKSIVYLIWLNFPNQRRNCFNQWYHAQVAACKIFEVTDFSKIKSEICKTTAFKTPAIFPNSHTQELGVIFEIFWKYNTLWSYVGTTIFELIPALGLKLRMFQRSRAFALKRLFVRRLVPFCFQYHNDQKLRKSFATFSLNRRLRMYTHLRYNNHFWFTCFQVPKMRRMHFWEQ